MDDTTGSGDDLLDAANRLQVSLNEDKVTHGQFVSMSLDEKDIIILIQESLMLYEYMYMIVIIKIRYHCLMKFLCILSVLSPMNH